MSAFTSSLSLRIACAIAVSLAGAPSHAISELAGIAQVHAGADHSCALTTAGGIKCWGDNTYGQLGTGSGTGSREAIDVPGLSGGVTAVATGGYHTCALTTAGGVKCWGANATGQVGDGTAGGNRMVPVDVAGLASGAAAIAAGGYHSCAVTTAGAVMCWGYNDRGQVGDNSAVQHPAPLFVPGLSGGVKAVAAGNFFTCALTTPGGVKCWGSNTAGQLGDDTTDTRPTPADVSGLASGVSAIGAGGAHACARTVAGAMKCWGSNIDGQLGDGSGLRRLMPIDVRGLASGVTHMALGLSHTCAVTHAGGAKCWGYNEFGELGDGTTINRREPVDVVGLSGGVAHMAAGGSHTCAVTSAGGAKCWGYARFGQLGDGSRTFRADPVDVPGLSDVAAVSAGAAHTCALTASGGVKCWGSNEGGKLGDGTTTDRPAPVNVAGLSSGVVAVSAGNNQTCALLAGGAVKCWGGVDDGSGARSTPQPMELLGGIAAIGTGRDRTCVLTAGGAVRCWGYTTLECTGGDSIVGGPPVCWNVLHGAPEDLPAFAGSRRLSMAASSQYLCTISASGGLACTLGGTNYPASGFMAVGHGYAGTCGIATTGAVACWGPYLGAGDVGGLASGASAVTVGQYHACALAAGGMAQCWGQNDVGQLGNGTTSSSPSAVTVPSLQGGAMALSAGNDHTCAVTAAGGVKCWGSNLNGQLGNGRTCTYRPYPAAVVTAQSGPNHTALWGSPAEPGWGLGVSHQGSTIFATLFTYAGDGRPLWLVASNLALQPEGSFAGPLYRASGPPVHQVPWAPALVAEVGRMTLRFGDAGDGTLSYTYGSSAVSKSIRRQVFSSPVPTCTAGMGSRASLVNYQDLWWNPQEPGWGINLAHQGNILFATLFTYASDGRDLWMVASSLDRQSDGSFSGSLYSTFGSPFYTAAWQAYAATDVGRMTLRFASGEAGTLDYSVSGTRVIRNIVRQVIGSTVPFCR